MTTISIDEQKSKLQSLRQRAEALAAKKVTLEREVLVQEENQRRAIQDLKDLGYPEVETMTAEELEAFGQKVMGELTENLQTLDTQVSEAERLLGISQVKDLLD